MLLCLATKRRHKAIVKLLVNISKVDVDSQNNINPTPLSLAAKGGHEAVIRLL